MLAWFAVLPVPVQAILAGGFTAMMTEFGSVPVFFTSRVHPRLFVSMLGMAAGVMVAACFWSLLAPANSLSNGSWLPAAFGFH